MGKHEKGQGRHGKKDGAEDRPPALTGKDLCRKHGHGPYKKFSAPTQIWLSNKWEAEWRCERCGDSGKESCPPPRGKR